jgi:aspartate aminotransferase
MKLAARVNRIAPSPTLAMAATAKAMAAQGLDVVDFSSGEPDFDTPEPVKAAAEAAIRSGFTKYTPSSGIDELREAIVEKLRSDQGLRYEKSQILVSCGAKHSLYNLAEALLEADDEVIIPTPYWVSYADQALLNDATPVLLATDETRGYGIDPDDLRRLITPRTKAIIINSPCNPTGATYDRSTLEAVADIAVRQNLIIISDEIYEKVLYDGAIHLSIAALGPEVAARTVIINGVSKAYAMTGWRIGGRRRVEIGRAVHRQDGCGIRSPKTCDDRAVEQDSRRGVSDAERSVLRLPEYPRHPRPAWTAGSTDVAA